MHSRSVLPGILLRVASPQDAPALLDLYAPYVRKTAITFEYQVPSVEEFSQRISHTLQKYPFLAAEKDGHLIGYAYAGSFHARPAYDWAVETSIYVDRLCCKKGVGRLLHDALQAALFTQGICNMNACIACPAGETDKYLTRNSLQFHAHMGYRLVGEFSACGYKFGRWYNVAWMEKHIRPHLTNQPPVLPFFEIRARFCTEYGIG